MTIDSEAVTQACVALFVTTSLLQAGSTLSLAEVGSPLRSPQVVIGALLGNFVLVPAAALAISRLFSLTDGLSLGLLLVAMSAGAPFLPRLVALARGDAALGVAVMTLLLTTTVVYLPLVLPRFAPGVHVEPWAIARPVLILMLAPLGAGLAIRAGRPKLAQRLGPPLGWISRIAMILVLALIVVADFDRVVSVSGSGALASAALLVLASIGIGFACGGASRRNRRVLAMATGQRGISAALLVATHVAHDHDVAVMVVVVVMLGELIMFSLAAAIGRSAQDIA